MKGNSYFKRLANNIVCERGRQQLTQEQLGLLSDIDRTYIARIEEGRANPTVKSLNKIAKALRVKLSRLMRGV